MIEFRLLQSQNFVENMKNENCAPSERNLYINNKINLNLIKISSGTDKA